MPDNANAKAIMNYMEALSAGDSSKMRQALADDIVFDGLMFQSNCFESVVKLAEGSATNTKSMKIEAITECADPNHYLVLFWMKFAGTSDNESVAICDYITLKDGKIKRINNVFDVNKVPQKIKDAARAAAETQAKMEKCTNPLSRLSLKTE